MQIWERERGTERERVKGQRVRESCTYERKYVHTHTKVGVTGCTKPEYINTWKERGRKKKKGAVSVEQFQHTHTLFSSIQQ